MVPLVELVNLVECCIYMDRYNTIISDCWNNRLVIFRSFSSSSETIVTLQKKDWHSLFSHWLLDFIIAWHIR